MVDRYFFIPKVGGHIPIWNITHVGEVSGARKSKPKVKGEAVEWTTWQFQVTAGYHSYQSEEFETEELANAVHESLLDSLAEFQP